MSRTTVRMAFSVTAVLCAACVGCATKSVNVEAPADPAASVAATPSMFASEPVTADVGQPSVDREAVGDSQETASSDAPAIAEKSGDSPAAAGSAKEQAPGRVRGTALGQFGGLGGGGGGGMGGMMGGGGGGMGGGGMGGGGMGGGMGGGGGGGGVSIDPKIQLKSDSGGKLDERRKESLSKRPGQGKFSSE